MAQEKESKDKETLKKEAAEKVSYYGPLGGSCCQSILAVSQEVFGLEDDIAFRAGSFFGGGPGRHGSICGALVGAVMALGMKYGRSKENMADYESLTPGMNKSLEMVRWFENEFGSVRCHDITGIDFFDDAQRLKWRNTPGEREKCWALEAKVIDRLIDLIE